MDKIEELAQGIKAGKRMALAKGITLIESNLEAHQIEARALLNLLTEDKKTIRIGVSGVPGVGKSTFIEAFGNLLIEQGHRLAILAVDPSSPATGGSILGDKTRMESLSAKKEAFIRPSPTSGTLGGVTKRTRETILLCEAAGFDVILVETVGVGQSEFEVASMVDCFVLMMIPGAGDSLQGIKRGILEITDILLVNKADGDQEKLAHQAKSEYENAFHLVQPKYEGISVELRAISALQHSGISETWELIKRFIDKLNEQGIIGNLRKTQNLNWFRKLAEDEFIRMMWSSPKIKSAMRELQKKITNTNISPSVATDELIKKLHNRF